VVGVAEPTPEIAAAGADKDARHTREDTLTLQRFEQFVDREGWPVDLAGGIAVVNV
jgi:hypothetical protein